MLSTDKFSDTLYDKSLTYFGINQIDLLRQMAKPNVTANGVIFNIDFNGQLKDSTTAKLKLFLTMLIGTDVYTNKIRFYGCTGVNNCQARADYSQLIGDLDIALINQVKLATLEIMNTDGTLASVKLNGGSAASIKFYPTDKTKLFILVKGCPDTTCATQNDFYVGGIYSYICKINL